MGAFLLRRLWQSALLLVVVTVLVFVVVLVAGDPVRVLLPIDASPSDVENLRHQFGLDQPIWVQYALFLQNAASGDLGQSFKFREPAMPLVLERLPITAILAFTALAWATAVSLPLGIIPVAPGPDSASHCRATRRQPSIAPWPKPSIAMRSRSGA